MTNKSNQVNLISYDIKAREIDLLTLIRSKNPAKDDIVNVDIDNQRRNCILSTLTTTKTRENLDNNVNSKIINVDVKNRRCYHVDHR